VTAIYFTTGEPRGGGTVRLHFPDKTEVELYSAVSASGARYTNNTAEWWEHQSEATYDVGGTNIFHGKIMAPK
jgi:membrane-bound inhibitor of C-type lysozyme